MAGGNSWMCVNCGHILGQVSGGELRPTGVPSENLITRGPNLVVTCHKCNVEKTWYTADPIVRALYQLVDATATAMAGRMIYTAGKTVHKKDQSK